LVSLPPDAEKAVRRRLLERARQHMKASSQRLDPERRITARVRELQLEWRGGRALDCSRK
jgi:hypothetical protein